MSKNYNPNREKNGRFAKGSVKRLPPERKIPPDRKGSKLEDNLQTLGNINVDIEAEANRNNQGEPKDYETIFQKSHHSEISELLNGLREAENKLKHQESENSAREDFLTDIGTQERIYHAKKENQNSLLLSVLSQDPNPDVRAAVAENTAISEDLCAALAEDADTVVLSKIAKREKLPKNTFVKLFQRTKSEPKLWPVKYALIDNVNTPKSIIKHYAKDSDSGVAQKAKSKMSQPAPPSETSALRTGKVRN